MVTKNKKPYLAIGLEIIVVVPYAATTITVLRFVAPFIAKVTLPVIFANRV